MTFDVGNGSVVEDEQSIQIYLALTSSPSSSRIPLRLPLSSKPRQLYDLIVEATSIPKSSLKVISRGRLVKNEEADENVVEQLFLENGSVIHCLGKPSNIDPSPIIDVDSSYSSTAVDGAHAVARVAHHETVASPTAVSTSFDVAQAPVITSLADALSKLRLHSPNLQDYATALQTLLKLLENITQNPMEQKYRTIKTSNAAFHKRLGCFIGAQDVMTLSGFHLDTECDGNGCSQVYVMRPSAEKWEKLMRSKQVLQGEFDRMNHALSSSGRTSTTSAPSVARNLQAQPATVQELMFNSPNTLQNMLQNPMVQETIRNDPRYRNNHQLLRQNIDMLANNPAMVQQMMRIMGDGSTRESRSLMNQQQEAQGSTAGFDRSTTFRSGAGERESFMESSLHNAGAEAMQGLQNVVGDISGSAQARQDISESSAPLLNSADAGAVSGTPPSSDDAEVTEEEMMAEAIARSLREM